MSTGKRGLVFNIQRFSLHDGTGIRTLVFLKGCPLRCIWCSNPEGQNGAIELRDEKIRCIGCGRCEAVCILRAITYNATTGFTVNRALCDMCGECTRVCPGCAKSNLGEYKTADEVLATIKRDAVFYKHSGGGVTIGGGEVLYQPAFAYELLHKCKELALDTAIETSGYGSWSWLSKIAKVCNTVFYDLKLIDSEQHRRLTGVGNDLILNNLKALSNFACPDTAAGGGPRLVIRVPVVPGFNSDVKTVAEIGQFIKSKLSRVAGIELLPFHNLGEHKYEQLGVPYLLQGMPNCSSEQVLALQEVMAQTSGIECTITSW